MKNTIIALFAALFIAGSVSAQSTSDSIAAKYQLQPMPQALTIEKTFPILGNYQLTTTDGTSQTISITLDSSNKGTVWVEGLPQGKLKAYLRQSPATYRIISQKSGSGKQVPEGTLLFDPNSNTLNVALGKAYDSANPAGIFGLNTTASADVAASGSEVKVKTKAGTAKNKSKVVFYSAIKTEEASSTSTNAAKQ
jgi:hypothetical protein